MSRRDARPRREEAKDKRAYDRLREIVEELHQDLQRLPRKAADEHEAGARVFKGDLVWAFILARDKLCQDPELRPLGAVFLDGIRRILNSMRPNEGVWAAFDELDDLELRVIQEAMETQAAQVEALAPHAAESLRSKQRLADQASLAAQARWELDKLEDADIVKAFKKYKADNPGHRLNTAIENMIDPQTEETQPDHYLPFADTSTVYRRLKPIAHPNKPSVWYDRL